MLIICKSKYYYLKIKTMEITISSKGERISNLALTFLSGVIAGTSIAEHQSQILVHIRLFFSLNSVVLLSFFFLWIRMFSYKL